MTSAPSITARRESRSAKTPPTRRKPISGIDLAAKTKPRSETDPVRSRIANESATATIPSPSSDVDWPMKKRRNWRSWSAPSLAARSMCFVSY